MRKIDMWSLNAKVQKLGLRVQEMAQDQATVRKMVQEMHAKMMQ